MGDCAGTGGEGKVHVLPWKGDVNPVMARYIDHPATPRSTQLAEADMSEPREASRDEIIEGYPDILTELRLLSTVSTLIFGFLLTSQDLAAGGTREVLYGVALVAIASATVVFLLPVVYHRAQYPYDDWRKFQVRSHFFIVVGTPILAVGAYLSVSLAMWSRWQEASLVVALLPLLVGLVVYRLRRLSA